jgi:Ca2+-binding EF-hand superfamily protein
LANLSFANVDADGDGSITETELQKALAPAASADGASGTSSANTAQADKLFKKIDANGDGKISPNELAAFQQKMKAHHHHHSHAADADDDSRSPATAANGQTSTPGLQNLVTQLYKSADANGDGQLSQAELKNYLSGSGARAGTGTLI